MAAEPKSTVQPFGRDLLHYVPAKLVPAAVAFIVVILLTHRLTPDAYGRYASILAITTLVDALASTWLRQSTLRYYPEYRVAGAAGAFQEKVINPVLGLIVLAAVGTSVALLALGRGPAEIGLTLVILVALIPFSYLLTLYQSSRQTGGYALVSLVQSLIQLAWVVAFVYLWRGGLALAATAVAAGYVAGLAYMLATRKATGIVVRVRTRLTDWDLVRRLLAYGLPMSLWFLCFQLLAQANRLIIASVRSPGELGPYASTGDLVNGSISLLMTPFLLAAHPVIMQMWAEGRDRAAIEQLIARVSRYLLVLVMPLFIVLLVLNQQLFSLVLGREFRLEGWVTQVLVATSFVGGLGMYAHKGLEVAGRTTVMLGVAAATAVLNLALNFLLVGRYGYQASAVIGLGSYCLYAVVVYGFSRRHIRISVPLLSVARVLAAGAATWLALWLGGRGLPATLPAAPRLGLLVVLAGAVYLLTLLVSGELAHERSRVADLLRAARRPENGGFPSG